MNKLFNMIKRWWKRVISPKQIQDKMKLTPAISDIMTNSIDLWYNVYTNKPLYDRDYSDRPLKSLDLGYIIADEKARLATLELQATIFDPTIKEDEEATDETRLEKETRATFLDKQYQILIKEVRHKLTPALALGTMVIKPIVNGEDGTISYNYVLANEFFPISFNALGKLVHAVFVEQITKDKKMYTRLETHVLDKGTITVTNEAYVSDSGNSQTLGSKISLEQVAEWQHLTPSIAIKSSNGVPLDRLLVATFTMPNANSIDVHSKLGMSCYAKAVPIITEAYKLWSGFCWEFEGAELAIDAPRETLKEIRDEKGNVKVAIPKREERLFRNVDVTKGNGDDLYNVFSPPIREASYIAGMNEVFIHIENAAALSRGTLSRLDTIAKTATETKQQKQKNYQSNMEIQQALQTTLEDIAYILDVYASLYNLAPQGEYDTNFKWDDSLIIDAEAQLTERTKLTSIGALMPEEVAAWYNGTTLEKRFKEIATYKELQAKYDPQPIEDESNYFKK